MKAPSGAGLRSCKVRLIKNRNQNNKLNMTAIFKESQRAIRLAIGWCTVSVAALAFFNPGSLQAQGYTATPLVADIPMGSAEVDTNLVDAWGMALLNENTLLVNLNGTDLAGVYQTDGQPTGDYISVDSAPSGVVLNNGGGFNVSDGGRPHSSSAIFVTENGTILGWNSHLASPAAVVAVDNSEFGAVYKGVAMIGNRLFAADFRNGVIDVYNSKWEWMGAFTDSEVDPGFGPFNVIAIDGLLYVAFAEIAPPDFIDDQAGPGNGYVDVFNASGHFVRRLVSHGSLNSPWGLAKAPANFGPFSGDLLVGNFGDGTINAFDIKTGAFRGTLSGANGDPINIDGLWALEFGTTKVAKNKKVPTLFFSAGPNDENDGVVGSILVNGN